MKKSLLFLFLLVLGVTQGWAYKVTFNGNGGTINGESSYVYESAGNTTVQIQNMGIPVPERPGYSFKGWSTDASGGTLRASNFRPGDNAILYAQWAPDVTITFHANGGTFTEGETKDVIYTNMASSPKYGELPVPTRTGHTLNGWFTTAAATGGTQVISTTNVPANNTTIYARWKANSYNVTMSIGNTTKTYTQTYGNKYTFNVTGLPTNTGYRIGWFAVQEGGEEVTKETTCETADAHTLYGRWIPNEYTVTFNVNGGDELSPNTKTVTYDQKYGELPVPTRTDYIFTGWNTAKNGSGTSYTADSDVKITAAQTLYAQWVNTLTVKFDLQGGNASPANDITVKVGSTYSYLNDANNERTLQEFPFAKKNGYLLEGWYTEPNGQGLKIAPSTIVSVENASAGMKLYANWEALNNTMSGTGTVSDPYIIMTPAHLQLFARLVNEGYVDICGQLGADINMSGIEWIPIGASYIQKVDDIHNAFTGTFDGNGYIVSNLTMTEPTKWDPGYGRSGLVGYANRATIKNVIVNGATLYAKWNNAAVCGRMEGKGTILNCGSFGTMTYKYVTYGSDVDASNLALNARAVAGVATTYDATNVSNVWSTYNTYSDTNNSRSNYVIGSANSTTNTSYSNYTQNSGSGNDSQKKTWVYVTSDDMRQKGALCYALNGNVDGGTAWTQTFGETEYANCPRPTNRGLAVYKEGDKYYNRKYTYTFDANGGSACPDLYVKRYSDNATLVYPTFAQPTNAEYTFVRWADENEDAVTEGAQFDENKTFHAHWMLQPSANVDPDNTANSYVTFYDSKYAYTIPTGVTAYKGKVNGDNLVLTAITTGVIPQGEAVILKSTTSGALDLVTVESDDVKDSENILKGSDAELRSVPENCYILTYGYNKLGFYKQPTSTSLKAHKAYVILDGQTSLAAKCLTMKFEDEATGVEDMTVTENIDKDIYNLNGMRLTKLQKGINIVGGNKVVVK